MKPAATILCAALASPAFADVIADWSTTPLPQNTPIWNIGESTGGFGDWCMYSHSRWQSSLWSDAWQPSGPVILPTQPNSSGEFKSGCINVPVPSGCSMEANPGGGYNGLGSCVASSDNVCSNPGDFFSVAVQIKLPSEIGTGMSGFTPAVWTYHNGHDQVTNPRDPAGTGPGTPGSGSEIDIEAGTLARYNRNGLLLVPSATADPASGTIAASATDPSCGAQGDFLKWPGQNNNDGCSGFALCKGFSQRHCKFTVGDSQLVTDYHMTDMITIAMDLYDDGGPGTVDLADHAIHEYRFDSNVNSSGKGCVTFYIDSKKIMGICDDHIVFYNEAVGAPNDIVCVRAYPGSTTDSFYWDPGTGTSTPITPAEFDDVDPTGTALAVGLNSAPAQLFIGPWMPTWTGTPCPNQQLNHEIHGARWTATHSADFNGDKSVDAADMGMMLAAWGNEIEGGRLRFDLDHNGTVDAADLGRLLADWSESYP